MINNAINPSHYKNYSVETIDMMIAIFGVENTIKYCEMSAFKYRMRMGLKLENHMKQDFDKEQWYLSKSRELNKLKNK